MKWGGKTHEHIMYDAWFLGKNFHFVSTKKIDYCIQNKQNKTKQNRHQDFETKKLKSRLFARNENKTLTF